MPIWYKINRRVMFDDLPSTRIEEVQVVRDTEKSVFLPNKCGNDRREAKVTEYYSYHPTREEARRAIVDMTERAIYSSQVKVQKQQYRIKQLKKQLESLNTQFTI